MPTVPPFPTDLLRRYARPGPRDTSYPTGTPIQRSVRPAELADAIRLSNGDPIPSRLSLYVLVPFSAGACRACERNRVAAPTARSLSETYRR
jgi:oxygen-independent coproporphyrinogen-3 oxidase